MIKNKITKAKYVGINNFNLNFSLTSFRNNTILNIKNGKTGK